MMEMKEQTGSRKKLLVPVVVLMLCLVTLTGAAYAYSSTMTNTGNAIDGDYVSIDLQGTAQDIVTTPTGLVGFADKIWYDNGASKQLQVNCYTVTNVLKQYKLKIDTDIAAPNTPNSVIVKSTGLNAILATPTITDKTLADSFKIYVNTTNAVDANAKVLTDAGVTLSVADISAFNVYLIVVAIDDHGAAVTTLGGEPTETIVKAKSLDNLDKNAEYFRGIASTAFGVTFETAVSA